jgi:hypothetical protein
MDRVASAFPDFNFRIAYPRHPEEHRESDASRRTTGRVFPQKWMPVLRSEHAQIQDSWPLILRGSPSGASAPQGSHLQRQRRSRCAGMTERYTSAFSRRGAPEFCKSRSPLEIRGRRECRAHDAPAASRANEKKHTSIVTTVTPERPGIPRAMVLRLTSCSPR